MTDSEQVKAALSALADGDGAAEGRATGDHTHGDGPTNGARSSATRSSEGRDPADYRTIIRRAARATDDLDAAAAFVEEVGVEALAEAVERAEREVSGLADEGRAALAAFERFRAAASEEDATTRGRPDLAGDPRDADHFHRGRDTSLGDAGIRPGR